MQRLLALVVVPLTVALACSDDSKSPPNSGHAGAAGASRATTGGTTGSAGSAATASGAGGTSNGGGGTTSVAGTNGSPNGGHAGANAGAPSAAGSGNAMSSGDSAHGGSSGANGAGTTGGSGGVSSGGMSSTSAGSGNPSAGSSSDAGGEGNTADCSRDSLKSVTDAYFTALAAHDPSTLPLASSVKFTENGVAGVLGTVGLWTTAGMLKYKHTAYDTQTCNSVSQSVVPDGSTDIPVAVRLKLEAQELTEVETIAVRKGDYSVASDTNALEMSNTTVKWEDVVPEAQRFTYDDMTKYVAKYYNDFPNGVCDTTSDCTRLENGGGAFGCATGAGCMTGDPATPVMTPHILLADVETGLAVGFALFTGGYADTHMFKMYGGKVYEVSAILAKASSTGWD